MTLKFIKNWIKTAEIEFFAQPYKTVYIAKNGDSILFLYTCYNRDSTIENTNAVFSSDKESINFNIDDFDELVGLVMERRNIYNLQKLKESFAEL